ncbi:acyltransferase [Leptothoe spongobia]|uniref:Acyltransferase n=1 Tax=Leptothoe spongobia TAU-MAC 1115 TaxID=1967444 RepID=A0A947DCI1_9CYAN|nr:acyltransferase [Leptothoe spongobia]MBT9314581.1 acyltransferase [Leptothoe spongobia TAU-MAC 1115]
MTVESQKKRLLIFAVSSILPWFLRRIFLEKFLGYKLHPSSRIGLSVVIPKMLTMEANAKIGDFTVCKSLDLLVMEEKSSIGRFNLVTGHPKSSSKSFVNEPARESSLVLKPYSAVTHRHLLDCTNKVTLGQYSILAGYASQLLTHSIDLEKCVQASQGIEIGDYCLIGSCSVLLPGSQLPDFSVLGAKALLNKKYSDSYHLYAGVPAKPVKVLSEELAYFTRKEGYIR